MKETFRFGPLALKVSLSGDRVLVDVSTLDSAPLSLEHKGTGRKEGRKELVRETLAAMELLLKAAAEPEGLMEETLLQTSGFEEGEMVRARGAILAVLEFAKKHQEAIAEAAGPFTDWYRKNRSLILGGSTTPIGP